MMDDLFEHWLYESESESLDFKQEQYKFNGASGNDKSELLKDILAMANSWRKSDGFLLIGIEEKSEKPNILHGITEHLDDANIQEFINSKVSTICNFEYRTYTKNEKTYGIIRVPIQKRPIYLKRDYGKLKANTVYVRRGSSTAIAKPDEVSKMGLTINDVRSPKIEIGFYDSSRGMIIGNDKKENTRYLSIIDEIPDYIEREVGGFFPVLGVNRNYYRELVEYLNFQYSYIPIKLAINNTGDSEATNLRIELEIFESELNILFDGDEIGEPYANGLSHFHSISAVPLSVFSIDSHKDNHFIFSSLDRIHAKRTMTLNGTIFLQVRESREIKAKAKIFYDGKDFPDEQDFTISIKIENLELEWKDFYNMIFSKDSD